MVKMTPFNIFGHPNLTFSLLKAIPEPKRCPLLLKVPIVAKKVPIVGVAGFSKSNSVFNPSHAFWLTASIQILPGSPEHSVNRVRINRPDALAWASDLPPRARVKHHVDDKA